jgi:hypothetical protein
VSGDPPRSGPDAISGKKLAAGPDAISGKKLAAEPDAISGERPSDDPPPILGSWRRLYLSLLIELALTVLILYVLARWAA